MKFQEQTFEAVKANPGKTAEELATLMSRTRENVASELYTLTQRGLLRREKHSYFSDTDAKKKTVFAYYAVRQRYVDGYEARRRMAEKKRGATQLPAVKTGVLELPTGAPSSTSQPVQLDVDNMTVGEAKRVYAQLREFFKGQV